jgi:hypothetical protein
MTGLMDDSGFHDTAEALVVALEADERWSPSPSRIARRSCECSTTRPRASPSFAECSSPSTRVGCARGSSNHVYPPRRRPTLTGWSSSAALSEL